MVAQALREKGFDGVLTVAYGQREWMVLDPAQVHILGVERV